MTVRTIPLNECRLLTLSNARRYVGGISEDRFRREVMPHCTPRLVGNQRFWDRLELDAWVDRLTGAGQPAATDWLAKVDHDLDSRPRR
jgi:hypothetical protein